MAIIKEVYFNDGEGLDYRDLNNVQRFLSSQLWDCAIGTEARVEERDQSISGALVCVGNGGYPYVVGVSMDVAIAAGVIVHFTTSTIDGTTPIMIPYRLTNAEYSFTIAASHATLERYDVIQARIIADPGTSETRDFKDATTGVLSSQTFNKRLNSVCTMSVVTGTNAAVGTATEPSVTSGYVKLATVYVAPTVTSIAKSAIRDYRLPSKLTVVDVMANQAAYDEADWVVGTAGEIVAGAAPSDVRFFPPPIHWESGRLIAVGLASTCSTAQAYIEKWDFGPYVPANTATTAILTSKLLPATTSRYRQWNLYRYSTPIWMDGSEAASAQAYENTWSVVATNAYSATALYKLSLTVSSCDAGDGINFARFIIAG
jgi:hypothetical protein